MSDAFADHTFSQHALRQAQRRGVARKIMALVLDRYDRSRKAPGGARALWISPRGRELLVHAGLAPSIVDRTAGVRLIVCTWTNVVITCEHAVRRRRWC
jgi:hypothetical protein